MYYVALRLSLGNTTLKILMYILHRYYLAVTSFQDYCKALNLALSFSKLNSEYKKIYTSPKV
jgi:hypothetical protein